MFERTLRSGVYINLGQSLIKSDPLHLIIQKATELGINSFCPLIADRSVVKTKMTESRITKWSLIARGACEQCGENWLPAIENPMTLDKWAKSVRSKIKIVLYS